MARGFGDGDTGSTADVLTSDSLTALGDSIRAAATANRRATCRHRRLARAAATCRISQPIVDVLAGEFAMPLAGIDPAKLHDTSTIFAAAASVGTKRSTSWLLGARRSFRGVGQSAQALHEQGRWIDGLRGRLERTFILMYAHLDAYADGLRADGRSSAGS